MCVPYASHHSSSDCSLNIIKLIHCAQHQKSQRVSEGQKIKHQLFLVMMIPPIPNNMEVADNDDNVGNNNNGNGISGEVSV
jgi:hypothetical protein